MIIALVVGRKKKPMLQVLNFKSFLRPEFDYKKVATQQSVREPITTNTAEQNARNYT